MIVHETATYQITVEFVVENCFQQFKFKVILNFGNTIISINIQFLITF